MWMRQVLLFLVFPLQAVVTIAQVPDCRARLKQAHTADSLGQHGRALALYDSLATLAECRVHAIGQRGFMKAGKMQMVKEGLADLDSALSLAPNDLRTLLLRCEILTRLQRFEEAGSDADRALSMATGKPDSCDVLTSRGTVNYRNRKFAEAKRDYDMVLKLDGLNEMALLGKSNVLRDMGHEEAAFAILEQLESIRPKDMRYMTNTAYALVELGRYEEALKKYDEALALFPNEGKIWNNRGYARLKSGNVDGAFEDVQKSLTLFANNSYAYRNLGLVEHERGNHEAGCRAWKQAIALGFTARFGPEVEMLLATMCK